MDDLISRQAVNDALDRTCNLVCQYSKKQRYSMCGACPLGSAFDALTEVPTIDTVKHGKWIDEPVYKQTMDGKTWDGYTYCSECGKMHEYEYRSNYCPNCGARMDL